MDQKEPTLLEKLQQMSRTGGKGTMRRKKIIKHTIINNSRTQEEKKIETLIKNINNKLSTFDPDTYQLGFSYIIEEGNIFFRGTSRYDMRKKGDTNKIRNNADTFFEENFIDMVNNKKVLVFKPSKLTEVFNNDGMINLIEFFEDLYKDIQKETFATEEKNEDEMDIKECFDILGLDKNEIPDKDTLSKMYRKQAIECHPDKHQDEKEKYEDIFKKLNTANKTVIEYYKLD